MVQTTGISKQIYETSIKNLPVLDRLQLVKLVLDDLMSDPKSWIVDDRIVDESDAWSVEDMADLTRASLAYADHSLEGE